MRVLVVITDMDNNIHTISLHAISLSHGTQKAERYCEKNDIEYKEITSCIEGCLHCIYDNFNFPLVRIR